MNTPSLNRRAFLATSISLAAIAALPAIAAIPAPAAPKLPAFRVMRLREHIGADEFGSISGVYAKGHIDPLRFVQAIDGDDVFDMLGDDALDEDENERPDHELDEKLRPMVKHTYAVWQPIDGYDDTEDSPKILIDGLRADVPGAFPITIIDTQA